MMIFQSCITSVASFLRFLTFSSISVHSWWSPKTEKMSGVLPYLSRTFRDDSSKYFNIFCNLTWSPKMAALCKTLNCGGLTWTIWISFPCLLHFSVGLFFFTKFVLPKWINQNKPRSRCPDSKAAFPIISTYLNWHWGTCQDYRLFGSKSVICLQMYPSGEEVKATWH